MSHPSAATVLQVSAEAQLRQTLQGIFDHKPLWDLLTETTRRRLLGDPSVAPFPTANEDHAASLDDQRLDDMAEAFAMAIDAKSPWTARHSLGVADVAVGIGQALHLNDRQLVDLRRAALVHDIGKIGVSVDILDKPGKLTADEWVQMKRHTEDTLFVLQRVPGLSRLADIAASHHERLDGKGYHRGIAGDQLCQLTRILAVADVYDALAAHRPYRIDFAPEQVMNIIDQSTPDGLCPQVVAALKQFLTARREYEAAILAA